MQMPDMEPSYLLFGTIFALENRLQVAWGPFARGNYPQNSGLCS